MIVRLLDYLPNLRKKELPYEFGFVPMGDSPSKIRIDKRKNSVAGTTWTWNVFSENLFWKGTLVDTGIFKILHVGVCWTKIRVYIPECRTKANYEITVTRMEI